MKSESFDEILPYSLTLHLSILNALSSVYNALCYNGIDGFWTIATTQFTVVLMACIILTFRAVFLDLEIAESDDVQTIGAGVNNKVVEESSADDEKIGHSLVSHEIVKD